MISNKLFLSLLALLSFCKPIIAQSNDSDKIREVIHTFFDGLHAGDTLMIKGTAKDNIIMQTIGKTEVKSVKFSDFLKSIATINPETTKIQEKILSYDIKVDGNMANAWTPYEFYVNDEFSHCGVNSFQLFKSEGNWKIFYIIDTRRKQDCNK
ncbi:nuclear transport factor 2 family protein [Aureibaculum sp. 2210JD6-5]|uniref:nuclear transport factor 2 family protein n=1 Tax=Aureibaculum sp. 2210JD6-5 TaxID=3103957 RepID=UPI002AACBEA0|nr:nuclear transport factor 2 family protein [Aureibaculum sp. 2210JD6-5]MDY7395593.1 nuclear transport factor 2 family protein [Aureibaculum sp. 2210JD6-5]